MTVVDDHAKAATFLWLDISRVCNLACWHCYNGSGSDGGHGTMQREDWLDVLVQAAIGGVRRVQLIGGEPTMHPDFADLVDHALNVGLAVEVFSNLTRIKPEWWDLFQRQGVSLATSYYSDDAAEHNQVTGRDSHRKTRANIARAIEFNIPIRTGVIDLRHGQRVQEAMTDLATLGVTSVRTDRLRHFGRGQGSHSACDVNELCGRCGDGVAAIGPNGDVSPCIMSGWMSVGNVRTTPLSDILGGDAMTRSVAQIPAPSLGCNPCEPNTECSPGTPTSDCDPRK